jgi:hypothetical protein
LISDETCGSEFIREEGSAVDRAFSPVMPRFLIDSPFLRGSGFSREIVGAVTAFSAYANRSHG